MNISDKAIELIKAEIQGKVQGEESIITDIEVNHKGKVYFADIEFKSTADHQETITGAWLGTDTLDVSNLAVFDEDGEELPIDNYEYVLNELDYTENWD